jgi:hypothetical protein
LMAWECFGDELSELDRLFIQVLNMH